MGGNESKDLGGIRKSCRYFPEDPWDGNIYLHERFKMATFKGKWLGKYSHPMEHLGLDCENSHVQGGRAPETSYKLFFFNGAQNK